jgi:hypothetical protein
MKRTKRAVQIPDAINSVKSDNFTQVPNEMLRDPGLSAKAKGILCLLLSNREGWKSHVSTIVGMMVDGEEAIRSGLQELEDRMYLLRVQYRDKESKQYQGMVWSYTDTPGEFDTKAIEDVLAVYGMEAQLEPRTGFSGAGKSRAGKSDRNKIKDKKTNDNNMMWREPEQSSEKGFDLGVESSQGRLITPSLFEEFWAAYPRKDGKGKAKTSWEKLCKKKERPTWKQVRVAIHAQKKSERWQDGYIPLPTTWLNQQRWLDDPAEMRRFGRPEESEAIDPKALIRKHLRGDLSSIFEKRCYLPARELFPDKEKVRGKIAPALISLYERIRDSQDEHLSKDLLRLMPGPITIIGNYIEWIRDNDWIRDRSIKLFDIDGTLFDRFRRDEAHKDSLERDPITGKSHLGK